MVPDPEAITVLRLKSLATVALPVPKVMTAVAVVLEKVTGPVPNPLALFKA